MEYEKYREELLNKLNKAIISGEEFSKNKRELETLLYDSSPDISFKAKLLNDSELKDQYNKLLTIIANI